MFHNGLQVYETSNVGTPPLVGLQRTFEFAWAVSGRPLQVGFGKEAAQ
jgi:hypothetical protein